MFDLRVDRAVVQMQVDIRETHPKSGDEPGKIGLDHRRPDIADLDPPPLAARSGSGDLHRPVGLRDRLARGGKENLAHRSELDAATDPVEEAHAEARSRAP